MYNVSYNWTKESVRTSSRRRVKSACVCASTMKTSRDNAVISIAGGFVSNTRTAIHRSSFGSVLYFYITPRFPLHPLSHVHALSQKYVFVPHGWFIFLFNEQLFNLQYRECPSPPSRARNSPRVTDLPFLPPR